MPRERSASLGLLLAVLGGCTSASTATLGLDANAPALVVRRGTLQEQVLLTGELEAAESEDLVAPRTESWAISIRGLAEDGASVREGDTMVELDNTAILEQVSDYELAVNQAGTELNSQRATTAVEIEDKRFEVETQRIALAKAEIDAEVPPELISAHELQELKLARRSAKTALATAKDALQTAIKSGRLDEDVKRIALDKARRKFDAATSQIEALDLRAPRDGVVVIGTHPWEGRKLQIGDTVWPGMTVAKLPDLQEMTVEAQLSDVDDGRVVPGMRARCVVDAFPDQPIEAVVLSVSPVAREPEHQSARRFFSVVLKLEQTDPETMRPGLSVKAEVIAARHEDVLLVPRLALDTRTDPARAQLASGARVDVEIGACNAQDCELVAGLEEGTELGIVTVEVSP